MKSLITTTITLILLLLCSCGNKASTIPVAEIDQDTSKNKSVETEAPNTNYKPSFEGQTRIAAVQTKTAIATKVLTVNLTRPWDITSLPDGRFLITEKAGNFRIVNTSGVIGPAITGIPRVNDSGQGGLLGVTIDPEFSKNRIIYWTFSDNSKQGNLTAVAKGRLSDDEKRVENAIVIYRASPAFRGTLHYGSRILFDREGFLVFSTGERSDLETRPQAQELNSSLGKIIRITTDGKPPKGNPFVGEKNARPELYSYGHRNPEGLAIHPQTGDLWESEMGPQGGDEINLIQPGKNYGWPTITYGQEYSGQKVGKGITMLQGMEQPIYYWDPVTSPSGMTFYNGSAIPEWKNNLFSCCLSSQHIARLVIVDNKVTGEERLLGNEGERFRDICEGKDGALYAVTDGGKLYRIGRK